MASSTVRAVHDALVEGLRDLEGLASPVAIADGDPGNDLQEESVIVGGITDWSLGWAAIGNLAVDESYDIDLFVSVVRPGDEVRDARARAFEIFAEVCDFVRSQVSTGTMLGFSAAGRPTLRDLEVHTREAPEFIRPEGRAVLIVAAVHVEARI